MKKISILLLLAMVVACLPGCKRSYVTADKTVTIFYKDGSTVTKQVTQTAPDPMLAEEAVEEEQESVCEEEQLPKLRACKAKRLLRQDLKEREMSLMSQEIAVGYYECNCFEKRANLFKLAANHIISFSCEEIINDNVPTYWVTVDLTLKGKLMQVNKKKLFPEDRINWEAAQELLTPELDQDEWGVPTYDNVVDSAIVNGMYSFYMALAQGQSFKNSLLSADMKCAMYLLETLKSFDVDRLTPNPFYRNLVLTPEMVDSMQIMRMPRLENGYMITLADEDFLYALEMVDGMLEIQDLVCVKPSDDARLNPTVCSIAGSITESDILRARKAKRERDDMLRLMELKRVANVKSVDDEDEDEHFEMCNIANKGIARVQHCEPTLYELAKQKELIEMVQLRAAKKRVEKVRNIKVERCGDKIMATGVAVVRTVRVSALGRIFFGLKEGTIEKQNVCFMYDEDEGWQVAPCMCKMSCEKKDCAKHACAAMPEAEEATVYVRTKDVQPMEEDDLDSLFDMAFDF